MHDDPPAIHLLDELTAGLRDELARHLVGDTGRLRTGTLGDPAGAVLVGAALPTDVDGLRAAAGIVLVAPVLDERDRVQLALAGHSGTWLEVVADPESNVKAERALRLLLELAERRGGLAGAQVGLVGFGPLGWRLAQLLGNHDIVTRYWGPPDDRRAVEEQRKHALSARAEPLPFDELLRTSDALVIDWADKAGEEPVIGRAELALMRDDALLVNTTSATALDDGALIQALRGGYLAGVALARTNLEPLPPDSPLRQFGRLLLRPEAAEVEAGLARRQLAAGIARALARRPDLRLGLRRVRRVERRRERAR